jgi:phenylpropionate dioxygenase-like ring-hydroxylating dioxygenase large terminal subunit
VSVANDRCPHRDAALSGGWLDDGCLVCPYHGWEYDTDGVAVHIPQLDAGIPIPPKARLTTYPAEVRHGLVWTALETPVRPIPELAGFGESGTRWIREFDEVWEAAAPRLMDNSFDPAHIAFVHRATFGNPGRPEVEPPDMDRTPDGLVLRNRMEVDNDFDEARDTTGEDGSTTVRMSVSEFYAPFIRTMSITYPNGTCHQLFTAATPVDDENLRLLQFAVRNDTEDVTPAAGVIAFDRKVTIEDQILLEQTTSDYRLELTGNVHIKIDRPTVELRRIYAEIVAGEWANGGGTTEVEGLDAELETVS